MKPLTITEAKEILQQYNCIHQVPITIAKTEVQNALYTLVKDADYYILGICVDNLAQGIDTLKSYYQALDRLNTAENSDRDFNIPSLPNLNPKGVYLKYNNLRDSLYVDAYDGEHRGVLVSCQSHDPDGINDLFGHLPLDLFT